jgi:hypothetical protein
VMVSGLSDFDGNSITPFTSGFQTDSAGIPDMTPPAVISTTPASGATGVANNSPVAITFSKPLNPVSVNATNIVFTLASNGAQIGGTYAGNGPVATFTPNSPLPASAVVNVAVTGVLDFAGNGSPTYTFSFTVSPAQDTTPPVVTSITPLSGTTGLVPSRPSRPYSRSQSTPPP